MPLTIADFVSRWKIAAATGTERQLYQQHFLALCQLLGQPAPGDEDPTHQSYCFERHVQKAGGGQGYADVWRRGFFAWEYKSVNRDLNAAYRQLNEYRDALSNPPLLVVSDFNLIRIHTAFENAPSRVYEFDLDDLKNEKATPSSVLPPLELLRALFTDPRALHPGTTSARVTEEAAKKFLQLAQRLEIETRAEQPTKEQIAHFLMRVIFCLFADSIGLLPHHVFRDLIRNSQFYPTRFRKQLRDLFRAMSDPDEGYFGQHPIHWFNGGLFNDDTTIELNLGDMGILREASSNVDWAHIEPAIFGTLFERSLDVQKRSLTGAHYTSREDILLLIEPVIMQPLLARWDTVRAEVLAALAHENGEIPSKAASEGAGLQPSSEVPPKAAFGGAGLQPGHLATPDSAALAAEGMPDTSAISPRGNRVAKQQSRPTRRLGEERRSEQLLAAWITELTAVRILDPACGSGNFLYMALRRMLDLWKLSNDFAREQGMSLVLPGIVSPAQLFGIETDFYAHELASIVVWIGFLQWKHEHGVRDEPRPILQKLDNIQHADAILRYDTEGKPYEPEWPAADYIVGNPPFLGGKLLRRELGDTYVDNLFSLYSGRVKAEADLVVYWFEKAREQLEHDRIRSAGLLATQGIRGGANRHTLQRIQQTGRIFYAWSDREWTLAGAAVHVSIIAFSKDAASQSVLDGQPVDAIHADLSFGTNTTSAQCLQENSNLCFMGTTKVGAFDIDPATAHRMLTAPLNPNGRPNSDVVKRWVNGLDIMRRDRGMYIVDFGVDLPEQQAALYELPFEYVKQHVHDLRQQNARESYRKRWWLHGEARPDLRKGLFYLSASETVAGEKAPVSASTSHDAGTNESALPIGRYIVTPSLSKHRIFAFERADTVSDHQLFVFVRGDNYFFGVLHSRLHELWASAQGTQLEDRPRYTPKTTFDTFPFPWPPGKEPQDDPRVQAIAAAAKNLVDLRDRWLNPPGTPESELKKRTLTNLYNARPQWLDDAHRTLDRAVFAAYGWPGDLPDQQILERLLALNHERAAAQDEAKLQAAPVRKTPGSPARRAQRQPQTMSTAAEEPNAVSTAGGEPEVAGEPRSAAAPGVAPGPEGSGQ